MDQESSSQSLVRKIKLRPRRYNEDRSLILLMRPEPTPATSSSQLLASSVSTMVNLNPHENTIVLPHNEGLSGQLLPSSVGAIVSLDSQQDTAVHPLNQDKNLIPEDQTQHPQELKQQVPKTYTFTIHTITVNAAEDVNAKIMSFCQQGPEAVWIFSAHGAISSATISLLQSPQTLTTYEGKYEISSLGGGLVPNENGSPSGVMTVLLEGLERRVVGGQVAGPLVAHGRVSVVVGRYLASEQHEHKQNKQKTEVTSTVTPTAAASTSAAGPIPHIPSSSTAGLIPDLSSSSCLASQQHEEKKNTQKNEVTSTATPMEAASTSTAGTIPDLNAVAAAEDSE